MASVSPFTLPRPPARRHPAGLWVILSGILLFVLLATFASSRQNDRRARFEFSQAVDRYEADVERQLRALQVATLSMAAGMEVGTEPVSRARFDRLAAALSANESLGALGAITLLDRVEDAEIAAWRTRAQRQYPEYDVQSGWDAAPSKQRLLVRNRWPARMADGAIGRNMGAQAQHLAAARVADGSRLPLLSERFSEPMPTGPRAAYVMMAPAGPIANTDSSRLQSPPLAPAPDGNGTRHWISVLVLADDLFGRPLPAADAPLSVRVVDLDAADAGIREIFDSNGARGRQAARFTEDRTLSTMGRRWQVNYATTPAFEAANRDMVTAAIALAGLLVGIGVLLALLRSGRGASGTIEQRRVEARLRESIDSLDAAFSLFDSSERLVVCNHIYPQLFGSVAGQVVPGRLKAELLELLWQETFASIGTDAASRRDCWIEARLAEFRAADGCSEYPIGERWYSTTHRRTPIGDIVALRIDITARKAAEAAAANALAEQQRAETRLVQAIDSLDEAFALYDEDERLVIFNERNRELAGDIGNRIRIGMTKREVLEMIADAHVPEAAGPQARAAYIEGRLAEHRAGDAQVERRVGDGWYRISLRRTPLGDVVVTRADVTKAREREAQLEKLSVVASRTANSVVIIDEHNRIEWVNESFERQTGYRMEQVLGRSPEDLLTGPLTDAALIAEMARMIEQGIGCRIELINYRENGDPYWASIERQPIRDERGRVVRWIRLSLDVSERKRAELALRSSEAKNRMLAAVVQQTTAAVITKDLDNRVTSWNRGAERLYGYPAEQAIGRLSHEFLNPDITPEHLEGLLRRVRSGATDVNRLQHVRADGVRIDIESSHAPQLDDRGALVGRITVIRDITEQLSAQRSIEAARIAAEHAQEAMSTFLSNMSHELRTPMHAILSYARLGQERISRGLPDKTQQYLDRIEQSGVRLLALLNDLLDLSRLEAGRLPIDPGVHELTTTVDAVILEVGGLAQSRQLAIERTGLRSLTAWYDPARIAQVLTNVLGNAVKFSSPGGVVTISLGQRTGPDGRPLAEVVVADNGIGIPADEREAIFDKFVQSSTTRTGAGGTGLGLAISRELVHAHGGDIRAEGNPGGGTRFIFTLPREPGAQASVQVPSEPDRAGASPAQDDGWPAVNDMCISIPTIRRAPPLPDNPTCLIQTTNRAAS